MREIECAFCKGTRSEADTWLSARTGLRYCLDEYIDECMRAYGARAMIEPMGVMK